MPATPAVPSTVPASGLPPAPTAVPAPGPAPTAVPAAVCTPAPYRAPGWGTRNLMNRAVAWLLRRGVSVWGARLLVVWGRSTGALQEVPVNPLSLGDATYLVAPRGETQWVRNLRVAGKCDLRRGRREQSFVATEIADVDKVEVLRAYLARWKAEVGVFFDGVGPDSPDEDLVRIAPNHPVFRLEAAAIWADAADPA